MNKIDINDEQNAQDPFGFGEIMLQVAEGVEGVISGDGKLNLKGILAHLKHYNSELKRVNNASDKEAIDENDYLISIVTDMLGKLRKTKKTSVCTVAQVEGLLSSKNKAAMEKKGHNVEALTMLLAMTNAVLSTDAAEQALDAPLDNASLELSKDDQGKLFEALKNVEASKEEVDATATKFPKLAAAAERTSARLSVLIIYIKALFEHARMHNKDKKSFQERVLDRLAARFNDEKSAEKQGIFEATFDKVSLKTGNETAIAEYVPAKPKHNTDFFDPKKSGQADQNVDVVSVEDSQVIQL